MANRHKCGVALFVSAVLVVVACTDAVGGAAQSLVVVPAPIPPDGYVAGQATHLQFVLVPDANPEVKGIALERGDALVVAMPPAFKRNAASAIKEDSDFTMVLTKGWPQAPVQQAERYRIFYDPASNAIGARAQERVTTQAANSPGIKSIHLRGDAFINPDAGTYPVEVRHLGPDGTVKQIWTGTISILAARMAARLAPTNFHLGPGANADFQRVGVSRDAPFPFGLYLWDGSGALIDRVGVAPPDPVKLPWYTGGLLIQDTNGDKKLDLAVDRLIGGLVIDAPPGAMGQTARSPVAADGSLVLSGDIPRGAKFPTGGGQPEHGLVPVQFRTGSLPGVYRVRIILLEGSCYEFTITAQE